jgi:hypothetical protein
MTRRVFFSCVLITFITDLRLILWTILSLEICKTMKETIQAFSNLSFRISIENDYHLLLKSIKQKIDHTEFSFIRKLDFLFGRIKSIFNYFFFDEFLFLINDD